MGKHYQAKPKGKVVYQITPHQLDKRMKFLEDKVKNNPALGEVNPRPKKGKGLFYTPLAVNPSDPFALL